MLSSLQKAGVDSDSEVEVVKGTRRKSSDDKELSAETILKKLDGKENKSYNINTNRLVSSTKVAVTRAQKKDVDLVYYTVNEKYIVCGTRGSEKLDEVTNLFDSCKELVFEEEKKVSKKAKGKASDDETNVFEKATAALAKNPNSSELFYNISTKRVHTDSDNMKKKYTFSKTVGKLDNGKSVTLKIAYNKDDPNLAELIKKFNITEDEDKEENVEVEDDDEATAETVVIEDDGEMTAETVANPFSDDEEE